MKSALGFKFSSLSILALLGSLTFGCGTPDPIIPTQPALNLELAKERGGQIVKGFGACGFCHSLDGGVNSSLSGGRLMADSYGEVRGPNVTPANAALANWSDLEFRRVFKANLRPDGSEVTSKLHSGFEWLSDSDLTAITAYLKGLGAVDNPVESRRASFLARNTTGLFDSRLEVKGYVPAISSRFKREYGEYLTDNVARCSSCHNKPGGVIASEEYLGGGLAISFDGETKVAPNITMSTGKGIGSWSENDLASYLRTGKTPSGRDVDPRFCPVRFYSQAPNDEIEAVVDYLRSVPVVD